MSSESNILLMVLLILGISLSILEVSTSENINVKVSLKSQPDGHVHADMFIGNLRKRIMNNLSLYLDLNFVMENTEKLIGVQGFVRDAKRNNTVELPTCKDTSKDEEINALWSYFCPEKDKLINIVSRTEWGGKEVTSSGIRSQTADLLIVNGHDYKSSDYNYYEWMQTIENFETSYYGDLRYNFIISNDGKVFEGIGWNRFNYIENGGLGPRSLIIAFLKEDYNAEPSAAAIEAFNEFVKSAICKKELSLNYSLIPYYLIYDFYRLVDDSFERKEMRTWNSYKENLDFLFPRERVESIVPQIIPKENWRIYNPKEELLTLSSPIEYICLTQGNARCFFNCTNYLNVLERYHDISGSSTIPFNFILSEEGRVYEVMGWEETWREQYQRQKVLYVGFMGEFNSYGPSKPMFLALDALIKDGLRSGKLSTDYKIASRSIGGFLKKKLRKLDRYTGIKSQSLQTLN